MAIIPEASYETKVRTVFEEMDTKKIRSVSLEGFVSSFARFSVDFATTVVQDLHTKADTNCDGVVSYPEFQAFAECFPTLVDCLYYRIKDFYTNIAQKELIDRLVESIKQLREAEQLARVAHAAAQHECDDADLKLQNQILAVEDSIKREQAAAAQLEAARVETERARAELLLRVNELNAAKDGERLANSALLEAQHNVEAATRRLSSQEQQVALAEERYRDIERMLKEQQREVENQRLEADRLRNELAQHDARAREAATVAQEAQRAVGVASEAVVQAEVQVASRQQFERDAAAQHREAQADVTRQHAQQEADQRALAVAKENEAQRRAEVDSCLRAVEAGDRDLQNAETEERVFASKRMQVNDEERPLIDQEIRLREQRMLLESKEAKLVSDFTNFTGRVPRVLPPTPAAAGGVPFYSPTKVVQPVTDSFTLLN
eukprot:TRINITY_DN2163_c0_g1_i1.p1 TRINITY_DN2163_c0_g1~~TRINITY_DN2163_c0_g1_i1.p1  ORF type:complete len:436 (+),score=116.61 TRINITY_DN2163_c0_g1_i1:49-1356(+)